MTIPDSHRTTPRPIHKIACIGEVMIELVTKGTSADLNVAGDTYNTAVYLARSLTGTGIEVSYVTALGVDRFSDRIMDEIAANGIATGHIARHPTKMPGLYAIETDESGERSFTYWRSDSAARTLFGPDCGIGFDALASFDLIFLSGITVAILPAPVRLHLIEWLDGFRARGGTVAYDSNHRPHLWEDNATARDINARLWAICDVALPSVDDEMAIFGDPSEDQVLDRLRALGVADGALKRGSAGPRALAPGAPTPAFDKVGRIVDSTAAGDSFNAGFLAEWVRGHPLPKAMQAGHALASAVIQHRGAIVAL